MSILVIGATGTVGSLVVQGLAQQGAAVTAMVRKASATPLPAGVSSVVANLSDVAQLRAALLGVRTLFLLNALTADELTQSMQALQLAQEAGIERIVYLSVIHADQHGDVPHFASKHSVERLIETLDLPATILRPAYFMQNDLSVKPVIESAGVYPMPIGDIGCEMVDARDIADLAVAELLRRDRAATALPRVTLDVVGPALINGPAAAAVWGQVLQREIQYAAEPLATYETQMAHFMPSWMAYDLRLMMRGIQRIGQRSAPGSVQKLESILGRPLRTYADFVREIARPATQVSSADHPAAA